MSKKLLIVFLVFAMLLGGCATATPTASVEPTQPPAAAEATAVPTEVPAATAEPTALPPVTLTVMAAASLTESFTEIGDMFTAANPNVTVQFNFAGSQALAQQITQGAPADVFASANNKQMQVAVDGGFVDEATVTTFVKNQLVVIYPIDNPGKIESLKDLANPGLKLDFAAKEVPVGEYSLSFLDKAAESADYGAAYKDGVLANVVSYEDNVKAVLTKVSLDEADAGIVYSSDVTGDAATKVGILDIPTDLNVVATYPIAALKDAPSPEYAQAFVDMVLSAEGQAVLQKYGFRAPETAAAAGPITVVDALDRTVTLDAVPQRIVVTGKGLFMIADAIYAFPEAGQRIVAINSTLQNADAFLPMIDPNFGDKAVLDGDAGAEQIASYTPDLVILKTSSAEKIGTPIEALGIPVIYVDFETPETYQRDITNLGLIFNNPDRAKAINDFYTSHVDAVTTKTGALADADKPSTLLLYYSNKDGEVAFNVPPVSWIQTYLVQAAGGAPVWEDANLGNGWTVVTLEQVAAWDADNIVVVAYSGDIDEIVTNLKADPQWAELRAVKDGHLYGFATDIYSWDQPDTRWIMGLDWLAAKLHPDLFPDYNVETNAKTFYSTLYAMNDASFEANILPKLKGDVR
jgi:iron complex transport system substrate-binding protein